MELDTKIFDKIAAWTGLFGSLAIVAAITLN